MLAPNNDAFEGINIENTPVDELTSKAPNYQQYKTKNPLMLITTPGWGALNTVRGWGSSLATKKVDPERTGVLQI